ncbi:hypothetical protein BRAS3809_2090002 [Bradyrhizobium sp. STM 3809]|nr:hypothetical protein BRAS3809_2090002 [Bradyrhizobium sp. STM 3809]
MLVGARRSGCSAEECVVSPDGLNERAMALRHFPDWAGLQMRPRFKVMALGRVHRSGLERVPSRGRW